MNAKMPRGAIPTPRSEFAASEPYQTEPGAEVFSPSGAFPTPNHELAAAQPYRGGLAPESFLAWPIEIGNWEEDGEENSRWAEEAFAKACTEPKIRLSSAAVRLAARECGASNFARFMQTHGFREGNIAYLDGPFHSVNWTNTTLLNSAIANAGPVKIGIASANLASWAHGHVTAGRSGWAIHGLPPEQPQDRWASLCGYGPLGALTSLFERNGVRADIPPNMPSDLCYAMFVHGSLGIVDRQSLVNITGEAWVRNPTTIVKNPAG
ncbi:MAG TPA: hypothetical protein VFI23_17155 [Rhizomicrobium sp.]|nr:hypothetical protein [Rhizomicrobium sp.]